MALKLEDKRAIVEDVAKVARTAYSAIAAEYRGMSVASMTDLRKKARESNVYLRVVRNTLARRAVEGTDFECMQDVMVGPIKDFAKQNDNLVVKAVSISGRLLPASEIEALAKMPTYEQAVSMLMSVMKAPISKFVRTLAEPTAKFVRTVAAVRDQKEAA